MQGKVQPAPSGNTPVVNLILRSGVSPLSMSCMENSALCTVVVQGKLCEVLVP